MVTLKTSKLIITLLFIVSIALYFESPDYYSITHVIYALIVYLISAIVTLYNNIKRYKTIILFESLFSFSFLFVNYVYPTYIYSFDPYFSLFSRAFNESIMSKATSLATVGFSAFSLGILQTRDSIRLNERLIQLKSIQKIDLIILTILLLWFIIGNISALLGGYSMNGGGGFFFIFSIFYIYKYFAFSIHNVSKGKSIYIFMTLGIYILLNFIMGNRGEPLYLCVAVVFCYNRYVKKIPVSRFLMMAIVGLLIFYVVGKVRISSNQVGVHSQSEKISSLEQEENVVRYANELIINNRALYVLVDYADSKDYTYGLTWSMNVFSMIPFGQSFALHFLGIPPEKFSSTYLTTYLEFKPGDENAFGLGTNLIGDIYLCFGVLGVIVFMYLLGRVIRHAHNYALYQRSYWQILYIILIMLAVYYPRATLFSPLQMIAWTYALTLIYNKNGKVYLRGVRRISV